MKLLYKYIFVKAYFFCIKVFKEKEFPQVFAGGIVTLAITTNIIIALEIVEYMMLPKRINIYGEYHGYFGLISLIFILIYTNYNKKYLNYLNDYKKITEEHKRKLKVYSIIYLFLLFVLFFGLGALIREYNIANTL